MAGKGKKNSVLLGTIYPPSGAEQYGQEFMDKRALYGEPPLGAEQYSGQYLSPPVYRPPELKYTRTPLMGIGEVTNALASEKLVAAQERAGAHLKTSPTGDVIDPEAFSITSIVGAPGAFALTANTANTRTIIGTYTIPTGYRVIFDPSDAYQEVLFTPFTSVGINDTNFIVGDLDVVLESATGGKTWRIFESNTLYMRPASNVSSNGDLRKWQSAFVGVPGDKVNFYFTAATVMSTSNSVLIARVRVGRIVA